MKVNIEEAITFYAQRGDKEIVKKLRLLQAKNLTSLSIDINSISDEEESEEESESESDESDDDESVSDLESEEGYDMIEDSTDDDDFEVVEENISVSFKDGFYSLD
tara:strand:+ start:389 stop:706 length:318 start_codon:yes stop_codon:yes gene_type:complete